MPMPSAPAPTPAALIDEALALTHAMLASGAEGDWDRVIELEPARRERLHRAFQPGAGIDQGAAAKAREILALDKQLVAAGVAARDQVAGELAGMNKGRKAAKAYGSIGARSRY